MMSVKMWHVNLIMAVLMVVLVLSAVDANAEGDKNRRASPILPPGENTCIYTVPEGIDLEGCTMVESPDHSQVVFFCDGLEGDITVICDGED